MTFSKLHNTNPTHQSDDIATNAADFEDSAWIDWRERFAAVYDQANYASPLQSFVMRASHQLVERPYGQTNHFDRVLEVGAGTGEHLQFVRHTFNEYVLSDADPAALDVAATKTVGRQNHNVNYSTQVGERLSYSDDTFDRLIATHVLEHIPHPHRALREWRRVVKKGGTLSVLIPTDPGLAWRLGRHLGPRRRAVAAGIAYDYIMAREHVNACNALIALLRHSFKNARENWWPLPVSSMDLNLFFSFNAIVEK